MAILWFSKWRPSAMLDSKNLQFLSRSPCRPAVLLPHTKFCRNRTIGRWFMAKKTIFKMAAAAILNFKNFNFLKTLLEESYTYQWTTYIMLLLFNSCFCAVRARFQCYYRSNSLVTWLHLNLNMNAQWANGEQLRGSKTPNVSCESQKKYRGTFFNPSKVLPSLELRVFTHLWSRSHASYNSILYGYSHLP